MIKIRHKSGVYPFMGVAFGTKENILGGQILPKKEKYIVVYNEQGEILWLKSKECQVITE